MVGDLAIIYVLSAFTLLSVLAILVYQLRSVRLAIKHKEHSAFIRHPSHKRGRS